MNYFLYILYDKYLHKGHKNYPRYIFHQLTQTFYCYIWK